MMNQFKQAYMNYMNENDIKFVDRDDRSLSVTYVGDNARSIKVNVIFDDDDSGCVHFVSFDVGHFDDAKKMDGYILCNKMNTRFRWVKFSIDDDNDVVVDMDAVVEIGTAGEECSQLVKRIVGIIDDAYPEFMRAIFA